MNKIKTVKQYLKEGPPKFDIIQRRGAGKVLNIDIIHNNEIEESLLNSKPEHTALMLYPPETGPGIIQHVVRILDGITFSQGDNIGSEKGNGFVVSFNEDRIHCDVAYFFEQNLVTVDIDSISKTETLEVGDEFVGEDESLGGEKYDLGD
jgi:hypothetical protein